MLDNLTFIFRLGGYCWDFFRLVLQDGLIWGPVTTNEDWQAFQEYRAQDIRALRKKWRMPLPPKEDK